MVKSEMIERLVFKKYFQIRNVADDLIKYFYKSIAFRSFYIISHPINIFMRYLHQIYNVKKLI